MTILLSSALKGMEFQKGMPLPELETGSGEILLQGINQTGPVSINRLALMILGILSGTGILFIFIRLVKMIRWKESGKILGYFLLLFLIFLGLLVLLSLIPHGKSRFPEMPAIAALEPARAPLGSIPPLILGISALILAAITGMILRNILTPQTESALPASLREEAARAVKDLENGEDLKNVITRCYENLCQYLLENQNIRREKSMTAGEFREAIAQTGAPEVSINRLTMLFEAVRYGPDTVSSDDENEAVLCLKELIRFFDSKETSL